MQSELISNLDKLHTTRLGLERVKRNLSLSVDDVTAWCAQQILANSHAIRRKGKNWYIQTPDCVITVNASSYTIITAHRLRQSATPL